MNTNQPRRYNGNAASKSTRRRIMPSSSLPQQILHDIQLLDTHQQHEVLQFIRQLKRPRPVGTPPAVLQRFIGILNEQDAREIEKAIEEGCEQINENAW